MLNSKLGRYFNAACKNKTSFTEEETSPEAANTILIHRPAPHTFATVIISGLGTYANQGSATKYLKLPKFRDLRRFFLLLKTILIDQYIRNFLSKK